MTRPNIALSKAAQVLRENWQIVRSSNSLDSTVRNQIESFLGPMTETFANLDSKEKSRSTSNQDVYVMRWCFEEPQLDGFLSTWMQESAAFFVLLTQMRAIRGLVTHPQVYAYRLVNDSSEAI